MRCFCLCFCLCFKCLKCFHKRKIKAVPITSISILLFLFTNSLNSCIELFSIPIWSFLVQRKVVYLMYRTNTKGTLFYKCFQNFLMFLFRLVISKLNSITKPQKRGCFVQSVQLTQFCLMLKEPWIKNSSVFLKELKFVFNTIFFTFFWFQRWDLKHDYANSGTIRIVNNTYILG